MSQDLYNYDSQLDQKEDIPLSPKKGTSDCEHIVV